MPEPDHAQPSQTYDLTNCDREPIHILGKVQDYGCLIAVSSDWMITHSSTNCGNLLGHDADKLIGRRFIEVFPEETVHHLRTRMQILSYQLGAARIFAFPLFGDARRFDVSISQSGNHLVFEFEPRTEPPGSPDDRATVQALIARVQRHDTIGKMAKEAARGLKMLAGFDRVMVYRFNEDESGTVIAEQVEPDMEPFLGLRYPASDIPKQARALYTKSLLRIIPDVDAPVHQVIPEKDPLGAPLDLSLTVTRAVSPIHLEYLRNMGVHASMSVSILRQGKLWGLFACHHRTPRYINYETRSAVELYAQLFNYELAQIAMSMELTEFDDARALHDQMMSQLSGGKTINDVFSLFSDQINAVVPFDGAAIYSDGEFSAFGTSVTQEEFIGLARFLNTTPSGQVYATDRLAERYPPAEDFANRVSGLLALPISRAPRDYLVLFRNEIAKSVNWAGNPEKPVDMGLNGIRLTPRKSFEAWQQIVRGQSAPWRSSELRAADALRVTLLEVVLKLADERNALRKQAQDQQELLIAELNHRVRNILNLIRGLVAQGKEDATSIEAYREVLDARIYALARAHDQLTQTSWSWVPLRTLIATEVKAYLSSKANALTMTGDEIELSPTAFTTLALVLHELVTNSAKYGALIDSSGSVSVHTTMEEDGVAKIAWREQGGPPVQIPQRRGFGTTIIERSIPYELGGSADLRFRMTGLEADFVLPAPHVRRAEADVAEQLEDPNEGTASVGLSGHCLVVEDNMVIAIDGADMLSDLGANYVSTASRAADALDIIANNEIAFALLDVNLGNETSLPVAQKCAELGIPALLATGYGRSADLVATFPEMPILKKPFTMTTLQAALAELDPE
ncbi:MAG: HWE histidine kinase domain-containing protein [Pseudomonadota bacterium]